MKEAIRQRARALGFDDCRFTTAESPAHAAQFQRWLHGGQHGEMGYLARNAHKRVDPQQVLPGAKSVICLATSYHLEKCQMTNDAWTSAEAANSVRHSSPVISHAGAVARYARFQDYHDVLAKNLKALTNSVDETGGAGTRSLWYVDTGPLLERDLAERAGLGFAGKHTNLISRHLGNWIFLAEIITKLELDPDAPETNRCGSCTRCITACPTNAITAPFELDARRCISYLTIELKGPIPVEFRRAIGNRIYGCDDCLAVCPWNRFAREGQMMKHHARPDLTAPDLVALLSLHETSFKRRFAGTPILRAKRRGFLRNVCVALGNVGNASALPALDRAAQDPEPLIAGHARWAMDEIAARHKGTLPSQAYESGTMDGG